MAQLPLSNADPYTSDWILSGAYYDETNQHFVLTEDVTWSAGAMWYNQPLADNFTIDLDYYTGSKNGADGIVVAFYAQSNYTPSLGGSIGFDGCSGYGIEIDTYRNTETGDPWGNHIALIQGWAGNHLSTLNISEAEDGNWHHLKIDVQNGICNAYIDGSLRISHPVEKTGYDWIGITAATGSARNLHAVKNILITGGAEAEQHAHSESMWITDVAATCTSTGKRHTVCLGCQRTLRTDTLSKLPHKLTTYAEKSATCAEPGWHAYEECSTCDYTTFSEIPPLTTHSWDEGTVTKVSTHLEYGTKEYSCTVCSETKIEILDRLPDHTYTYDRNDVDSHITKCECGFLSYELHVWDNGITAPATHTAEGSTTYTCTDCGEVKTEVLPTLPAHTFGDWQTYNEEQHMRVCECGFIDYVDHTWDIGVIVPGTNGTTYSCIVCGTTKTESSPAYTAGDVNGDGVISNKDLIRMTKYMAGIDVEVMESALDVNGDGVFNAKDQVRLKKILAQAG